MDIFRIGCFGLKFDFADQTCKSSCAYVFPMEYLSSLSSYVLYSLSLVTKPSINIMFPVKARANLPVSNIVIYSISVRG